MPHYSHLIIRITPLFFSFFCWLDSFQLSTLVALQHWVSHTDINSFDILLCIGNKVDRVPHHLAHDEYRRRLLKATDSSSNLYPDIDEFGISESEGSRLLGSEDASSDIRGTCLEWCCENNIEFIEACASNPDFDKCKFSCVFSNNLSLVSITIYSANLVCTEPLKRSTLLLLKSE